MIENSGNQPTMPGAGSPNSKQFAGALVPQRRTTPPSMLTQPAAVPAALLTKPNLALLLRSLRRQWPMAMFLGMVCAAGAGFATWYFFPPSKWTARTSLRIPATPWAGKSESAHTPVDPKTHVALIRSRLVLNSALKQPKVADLTDIRRRPDPMEWLESELRADFSVAPEVLRIWMSGDNPVELKTIVQEVREAYRREVLDQERMERNAKLEWYGQQRERFESQLRQWKDLERGLRQKTGKDASSRSMLQGFVQMQLNWTERELLQTQSEIRRLRAVLAVRQTKEAGQAEAPIPSALIESLVTRDREYQLGQERVRLAQRDIDEFKRRSVRQEKDPAFGPLSTQLRSAEESLVQIHDRLVPQFEEEVRKQRRRDSTDSVEELKVRAGEMAEYEKELVAMIDRLRERLEEMSRNVVQLDDIREDMSLQQSLASRMAGAEEALRLDLMAPDRVKVLEDGVLTRIPDQKRLALAVGLASAGAFGLVCLAFAFGEFRARRINTADEVTRGLGLRLVGTIPDCARNSARRRAANGGDEFSVLSEAVDTTRTMLLQAARSNDVHVVMITSAYGGEGKTSLATHLAASLSTIGHSTLLIDADLRNPIAHSVFGLDLEPGLCDVLRGDATVEQVIRPAEDVRPAMITAGRWESRAARALAHDSTGQLIQSLRKNYEFIIIDTSPVLPVADPLLIGQHADGTILSVLRNVSRLPSVYAAHQRLSAAGVNILGAVVNGVRGELYESRYSYPYPGSR